MQTRLIDFIEQRDVAGALKQVRKDIAELDIVKEIEGLPKDKNLAFYGFSAYFYSLLLKVKAGEVLSSQEERDYEKALEMLRQRKHRQQIPIEEQTTQVEQNESKEKKYAEVQLTQTNNEELIALAGGMLGLQQDEQARLELQTFDFAELGKTILGTIYAKRTTTFSELCNAHKISENTRTNKILILITLLHLAQEKDDKGQALIKLEQKECFEEIFVCVQ